MALPADFSKIYGSTATGGLTPISDVNYAKGWEFVGSNPPTKNDFSYLQNLSDLKSQWLYSNKLQRTDPFGDIKADGEVAVAAALANLGLGNAATKNVGTVAGTVAAGDDPRFLMANQIGYALLSLGTVALGNRYVLENPYGNSTPVITMCEIFHSGIQKWVTTPWAYSGGVAYGISSSYSEGEGVVVRAASAAFVANTANSGTSQEFTSNYSTPSHVRVHVWEVKN